MNNTRLLDEYFSNFINENNLSYLSVAVSNSGQVCYDICKTNNEHKNLNDYTKLNLGTLSEILISILILKLIEDGKITAYDYVNQYIPEFPYENVNIINLLTHTSGIQIDNIDFTKINDQKILFAKYAELQQPVASGTEYNYCCYEYSILLDIIQRVTKSDIDEYANEVLYESLHLRRTAFSAVKIKQNILMPYDSSKKEFLDYSSTPAVGSTGVFSDASELLTIGNIFLDFYAERSKSVFSDAGFKFALTPGYFDLSRKYLQTPIFYYRGAVDTYSCFGDLSSANTFGRASDTGCMLSVDLDNDVAISIMTNDIQFAKSPTNYKKIINRIMSFF